MFIKRWFNERKNRTFIRYKKLFGSLSSRIFVYPLSKGVSSYGVYSEIRLFLRFKPTLKLCVIKRTFNERSWYRKLPCRRSLREIIRLKASLLGDKHNSGI
jgi:hypothetical protein